MKTIKRVLSVTVMLCMLISLFAGFTFAETESNSAHIVADGSWIEIYADRYSCSQGSFNYSGDYIISGNFECLAIRDAGTYNITLHAVDVNMAETGFYAFEITEDVELNLTVIGKNSFKAVEHAALVSSGSKVVLDLQENSSLSFESESTETFIREPSLEMKDGSAVPGTDQENWYDFPFALQVGTPADCEYRFVYENVNLCRLTCDTHNIGKEQQHHLVYSEKDQGHIAVCEYCGYEMGQFEAHWFYYSWQDKDTCLQRCDLCGAIGESKAHDMSLYDRYDKDHCINYCKDCGGADEQTDLIAHRYKAHTVKATKIEAAHTLKQCERCSITTKEYDNSTAIKIDLTFPEGTPWNSSALIVYVNGEPVTLVRNYCGNELESYALPYDEKNSYSFRWIGDEIDKDSALKIYLPGQDEPVFSSEDMTEYANFEEIYSLNMADYSELDAAMAKIPAALEYYTKDSVAKLVTAVKNVKRMLPARQQNEVDKMAAAMESAVEALVPTDEPTTFGVINLVSDFLWISAEGEGGYSLGEKQYEYKGAYTVFSSNWQGTEYGLAVVDGKVDITFINTLVCGNDGNFGVLDDADVQLKALGTNAFVAMNDYYAGIDVFPDAKLTIEKTDGSIVAVGSYDSAGIGGNVEGSDAGEITINGGIVYALSPSDAAGIGGGYNAGFNKITINGGRVHAECLSDDGAGIGCGDDGDGGNIVINGGDITALSVDDDGAGIGGADHGYCKSITINGGSIVVGSDDAAGIGGGQEDDSIAGKVIINGGAIIPHFAHKITESLVGNGSGEAEGKTEDNFVQINGGAIFDDGYRNILPAPTNKNGKALTKISFKVHESYNGKEVLLQLDNGTVMRVPVLNGQVQTYIEKGVKVLNRQSLQNSLTVKEVDSSKRFKDVKKGAWYKSAVDYAYAHGLVKGVKNDEFGLNSPVTRGMFITILARISGVDTSNAANMKAKTPFTDVKKGQYYAAAISWASKAGIVSGTSRTTFEPDAPIQRQQLCVMVSNFAKVNGIELKAKEKAISFADAGKIAGYARKAVKTCQQADIINGYKEGKAMVVKPTNTATRAEATKILSTFHKEFVAG